MQAWEGVGEGVGEGGYGDGGRGGLVEGGGHDCGYSRE